jgi:hypothetical protein
MCEDNSATPTGLTLHLYINTIYVYKTENWLIPSCMGSFLKTDLILPPSNSLACTFPCSLQLFSAARFRVEEIALGIALANGAP